jgi:hypothetical protein
MPKTILIYQMGKVGSATIQRSLSRSRLTWLRVPFGELPRGADVVLQTHSHLDAKAIIDLPEHRERKRMLVVLSLTRDLLRRNISAFFHNISRPDHPWWPVGPQETVEKMSLEELAVAFRQREWLDLERETLPWFDRFAETVGVDIFAKPFLPCGYRQYPRDPGRLAILRLENMDQSVEWLRRLFSTPSFSIRRENLMSETWQGEIYKRFLEWFRPSQEELDAYYNSKMMRYFYSPEEIRGLRARWEESPGSRLLGASLKSPPA